MKSLFLFLALAFLVHANPNPEREQAAEPDVTTDSVAQMAGGNEPADAAAAPRGVPGSCYNSQGYCYPSYLSCCSGMMFREQYNNCWSGYKCCVP